MMIAREDILRTSSAEQLAELLGDAFVSKAIALSTRETMHRLNVSGATARALVLSAIGEPGTLARLHAAWQSLKGHNGSKGLIACIIRRRVIDLLRKDARAGNHCSLEMVMDSPDVLATQNAQPEREVDPHSLLERQQLVQMVREALASFANQDRTCLRQAQLLRRYVLEEASYRELQTELGCQQNAVRVRVHKALRALRRHIRADHPELEGFLEQTSGATPADATCATIRQ